MSRLLPYRLFYSALTFALCSLISVQASAQANTTPETNYQRIMNSVNDNSGADNGQPASDTGGTGVATGTGAIAGVAGTTNTDSQQATQGYNPKDISIYGQPQFHQTPGTALLAPPVNQTFGSRNYNTFATTPQTAGASPVNTGQ